MNSLVASKKDAVGRLCRRYRVRRLELFGSATGDSFDEKSSDLDFVVEFEEFGPSEYAEAYFGLLEGLQALFDREIDLVVLSAVKNPYFRESIERSRTALYAA
jgi:predicted nucleotidyltransferase